jgi:hypothetical protein
MKYFEAAKRYGAKVSLVGAAVLVPTFAFANTDPTAAVIAAVVAGAGTVSTAAMSMLTSIIPIAIGVLAAVMVFRFGKRLISGLV